MTAWEPRPFDAELDGYAHVPRMLDKARATLAGTAGSYLFGCPVDHTCMARLGIAPDLVLDLVARHADDRDVLAELQSAHGIPSARDAWFDSQAVEDELQADGIYLRVREGVIDGESCAPARSCASQPASPTASRTGSASRCDCDIRRRPLIDCTPWVGGPASRQARRRWR